MKNLNHLLPIFLLLVSTLAQAGPSAPPQTPIDGGLGLLLAAGGLFGLKKLRDRKKG